MRVSGIDCEACGRKTQTFLCPTCQDELQEMLHGLASRTATNIVTGDARPASGWIELLEDAALGRTRLGESARRSTEKGSPMLFHQKASELLDDVHGMLLHWVSAINVNAETLTIPEGS